eukprot:15466697-Alexandrium_andersonii.AAC.1
MAQFPLGQLPPRVKVAGCAQVRARRALVRYWRPRRGARPQSSRASTPPLSPASPCGRRSFGVARIVPGARAPTTAD